MRATSSVTEKAVAVVSVGLAFALGTLLGCISGYYKGVWDSLIMRVMDMIISIPHLLLAIVIAIAGTSELDVRFADGLYDAAASRWPAATCGIERPPAPTAVEGVRSPASR